jgi:hypothetical protein
VKKEKHTSENISPGTGFLYRGVGAVSSMVSPPREVNGLTRDFLMRIVSDGKAKLQPQWHTPDEYLNAARELMGGIDIDPATDEKAQLRIKAKVYYTKETNGLDKPWMGRLWLGTPYAEGLINQFTDRAIEQYRMGNVTEGLILTHTNNTHYSYFQEILRACSAICVVNDCIRWVKGHEDEEKAAQALGVSWIPEYTKHGNVVFYLGQKVNEFCGIFSKFGVCLCPMKS